MLPGKKRKEEHGRLGVKQERQTRKDGERETTKTVSTGIILRYNQRTYHARWKSKGEDRIKQETKTARPCVPPVPTSFALIKADSARFSFLVVVVLLSKRKRWTLWGLLLTLMSVEWRSIVAYSKEATGATFNWVYREQGK